MDLDNRFGQDSPDSDDDGYPLNTLAAAHECVGDFWLVLRESLKEAGGDPDLADFGAEMTLKMFADCVAPNGIRMVFIPEATMDSSRRKPTD